MSTPETPVQLLTLMASTSTQVDVFSDGVIESVKRGEINPLTVLVQLRAMAQASERILKEIKSNILSESDKYPATFEFMGNTMTKAEHGTKYQFENCGHPGWKDLQMIIDKAKEQQKDIEAFLKTLKAPMDIRIDDELVSLTPPIKTSTSGINVKLR